MQINILQDKTQPLEFKNLQSGETFIWIQDDSLLAENFGIKIDNNSWFCFKHDRIYSFGNKDCLMKVKRANIITMDIRAE